MTPYSSDREYLMESLALVKVWLHRFKLLYCGEDNQKLDVALSNLRVDARDQDAFLAGEGEVAPQIRATLTELNQMEAALRRRIDGRMAATYESGGGLCLEELRAQLNLNEGWMFDLVLALVAQEVDMSFFRAFAAALSASGHRQVSIGFVAELLATSARQREAIHSFFWEKQHTIFAYRCLLVEGGQGAIIGRRVRLAPRLISFITGQRQPTVAWPGCKLSLNREEVALDEVLMEAPTRDGVTAALQRCLTGRDEARGLALIGGKGCGRKMITKAVTRQLGRPLIVVRLSSLPETHDGAWQLVQSLAREARLYDAVIYLDQAELLAEPTQHPGERRSPAHAMTQALETILHEAPMSIVLGSTLPLPSLGRCFESFEEVQVPQPSRATQIGLWRQATARFPTFPFTPEEVTRRFSLTGGSILSIARQLRRMQDLTEESAAAFIRSHLEHRLGSLATPVARGFEWEDLVVADQTREGLTEFLSYSKNWDKIFTEWGFNRKYRYGRGLTALFYGPPGTGKTMAASVIAGELGRDLFQIDLSRVVDKYIGETEKNLGRIFEEGRRAQTVLLFDEADSLFGQRTSVKSSNDRHANLETNFLLQQIEAYEGICILTTNFPENIDEAFKRRLRYKIHFPAPNLEEREELWRRAVPDGAPLAADVHFGKLAKKFEMSGAQIKNTILRAAAMAASSGRAMDLSLFIEAGSVEYREMGKLVIGGR